MEELNGFAEPVTVSRVRLLGEFELGMADGSTVAFDSARAESLVAFLALHRGEPQSRQRLSYLLWPTSTEQQARTNLRHLLHTVRRALPAADRVLEVTARTLRWRPPDPCQIDVAVFEDQLALAASMTGGDRIAALSDAVDTYTGDLLPDSFDDWVLSERERLRQRYAGALEQLGPLYQARGDHAAASTYAERLLREDPLREDAYRVLIRAYDARGDPARALHTYHLCASTLERELDVAPSAETRAVYEAVLPDRQPSGPRQQRRPSGPPLVGRSAERARLTAAWRESEAGRPQLVLISGDPGIGKTRLAEEFASWAAHRGATVATARAHAAEGSLAYAPIVDWLRAPEIRRRLNRLGTTHLVELARLLPELLTEIPGLGSPQPLPADEHRERLFEAVVRVFTASGRPVLLIADDIQYFDRFSLRLLHFLLRVDPGARVLVVATARPEDIDHDHPVQVMLSALLVLDQLTTMELSPLSRDESAALASRLIESALPEGDLNRAIVGSEGNPLFLIESLRAGLSPGGVSPKVQAVIASRLAKLSEPARDLIGLASAIGRDFTAREVAAATDAGDDTVVAALDELWTRRLIRAQGRDAYDFAHEKVREVAYRRLSPALARRHHLRIARVLEQYGQPAANELSGRIASHYEQAGANHSAVRWYQRAADVAVGLHANAEAVRLLDRAIELLRTLPAGHDRDTHELALLTALPAALVVREGYASPRLFSVQSRALELVHELDVEPEPPLVRSLALTSVVRSDFNGGRWFGEQLRERGERSGDDVLIVEGAYILGISAFWQARFEAARDHFELAARRYRPEHRAVHLLQYGQDPRVVCVSRLANTFWFLGEPTRAVRTRKAALELADITRHPHSKATALSFAALLALDMNDEASLRDYVDDLDDLGAIQSLAAPNSAVTAGLHGYLDVLDGDIESGIGQCHEAIDRQREGQSAPGARATLQRILLAAFVAAGDADGVRSVARELLNAGGAARVWQAESELQLNRVATLR
ncbi:MAG: AAA family ATPase [Actinophytocola sp.]|nr:AAA family ATPase [Actinophytocola sp.]